MDVTKQFESNWPICSFYLLQTELFMKLQNLLKKGFLKSQKKVFSLVFFSSHLVIPLFPFPLSFFFFFFASSSLSFFFLMIPFYQLKLNMNCRWWTQMLNFAQKFKEAIISVRGVEDKISKFYFEWGTYIFKWGSTILHILLRY